MVVFELVKLVEWLEFGLERGRLLRIFDEKISLRVILSIFGRKSDPAVFL